VVGYNAATSLGQLNPLTINMSPEGLAPYGATGKVLVGVPTYSSVGDVLTFDTTPPLSNGTAYNTGTTTNGLSGVGTAVATGNLGAGTAGTRPDVIAVAQTTVVFFPGDGSAYKVCGLFRPPEPTNPILGVGNLAIADVTGVGHDEVIVSGFDASATPYILVLDNNAFALPPASGNAYQPCLTNAKIAIKTGVASTGYAPTAIAVGNLDSDAHLEIVAGNPAISNSSGGDFKAGVTIYKNVVDANAMSVALTAPANSSTTVFGGRLKIAKVITNSSVNQLIVGDPGATPLSTDNAGQVSIFELSDPTTAKAVLYDPNPGKSERFGRDLATTPFLSTPAAGHDVLAVAAKDNLFVYFEVVPGNNEDVRVR
jgi:hypothetical protein